MNIDDNDETKKHFDWQLDTNPFRNTWRRIISPELYDESIDSADVGFSFKQPSEIGNYTGYETYDPSKIIREQVDYSLNNIHEPISEHDKTIRELKDAILELQLSDKAKDTQIQELQEQLWQKKREIKSRKKSKSKEIQLQKKVEKLEKIVKTYHDEWRFTKDMHEEESKDISEE